jgi:hypothetical protein
MALPLPCQEGKEDEIMVALMNKFIGLSDEGQKPEVFSAVNVTSGCVLVPWCATVCAHLMRMLGAANAAAAAAACPQLVGCRRVPLQHFFLLRGGHPFPRHPTPFVCLSAALFLWSRSTWLPWTGL